MKQPSENDVTYIETNKALWNKRVEHHVSSSFYNNEAFLNGKSTLNEIELELLGDVHGKRILHLQCHFGQDTMSLARMGAHVCGVDFSEKAIEMAKLFNDQLHTDVKFICSDVYEIDRLNLGEFDIIFTTYGVIGWLPDLDKWAKIIARHLKTGGKLVFVEFHPFIWMYDDYFDGITYSYFNDEPIIEVSTGTYAEKDADITNESIGWNHSISEVLTALLSSNLAIKQFKEFKHSPYNCLNGMKQLPSGHWIIEKFGEKMPLVYAIEANKKG